MPRKLFVSRRKLIVGAASLALPSLIFPRATNAFVPRSLLTPPPPAVAAGFNSLKFYSRFLPGDVDLLNSKNPQFKLFINNSWSVNLGSAGTQSRWNTTPPTDTSLFSFSNNGLTITSDLSGQASSLQSAVYTGGGPGAGATFVGTTFHGGWYVRCRMQYDPANSPASGSGPGNWPAYWFAPISFITGNLSSGTPFVEFDGYEAAPNTAGTIQPTFSVSNTTCTASTDSVNFNTNNSQINNPVFSGANFNSVNSYESIYQTQIQGGGTGLIQRFFNGQHISAADIQFSSSTAPNPSLSPSNPTGALSEMDGDTYIMIFGTGNSFPCLFNEVEVWGP